MSRLVLTPLDTRYWVSNSPPPSFFAGDFFHGQHKFSFCPFAASPLPCPCAWHFFLIASVVFPPEAPARVFFHPFSPHSHGVSPISTNHGHLPSFARYVGRKGRNAPPIFPGLFVRFAFGLWSFGCGAAIWTKTTIPLFYFEPQCLSLSLLFRSPQT